MKISKVVKVFLTLFFCLFVLTGCLLDEKVISKLSRGFALTESESAHYQKFKDSYDTRVSGIRQVATKVSQRVHLTDDESKIYERDKEDIDFVAEQIREEAREKDAQESSSQDSATSGETKAEKSATSNGSQENVEETPAEEDRQYQIDEGETDSLSANASQTDEKGNFEPIPPIE
ncbi:MAG: hypothetical protein AABW81_01520 [Nanoarchaeota archaeon]